MSQPFQNVQSTPPDQSLAPGAELAEQLPVFGRIRRTEVDGRVKLDDGPVPVASVFLILRRGNQPIDRSRAMCDCRSRNRTAAITRIENPSKPRPDQAQGTHHGR